MVYVSAHDNETLFDAIQLKAPPRASIAERVRMQKLGLSLVLLAQGVPFIHAGEEILRSKSLDRNSYDSGDWWNAIDWSYETNGWAKGLPPGENRRNWPLLTGLLAEPRLRAGREEILACAEHFREMLRVRRSSRLFRLRGDDEIQRRLRFPNSGPDQLLGVLAFSLDNSGEDRLDDPFAAILVVLNARREATEDPPSRPPRISSKASQPGVPSSREYARRSPSTKFDAGIGGTFSGDPGRRSRPAETNHDSIEP